MTIKENNKLERLILEVEQLSKTMNRFDGTMVLHTEEINRLLEFRKTFRKEDGWIPKIVDGIRENFRIDFQLLRKELLDKFDTLPCFDLKFNDEGKLQSKCRIANEKEPLAQDEKEL